MSAIVIAVVGIAVIVIIAVVVGIMDAVQAAAWRRIAMERQQRWAARWVEHHGRTGDESWAG